MAFRLALFSHSSQTTGAERSLVDLVIGLAKRGVECHVIVPADGPLCPLLRKAGAGVLIVQSPVIARHWWWATQIPLSDEITGEFEEGLRPAISRLAPAAILSQTIVSPWGALCAEALGLPHFLSVREYGRLDHDLQFYPGFEACIQALYDTSTHVFCVTQDVRRRLFPRDTGQKTAVIYSHIHLAAKPVRPAVLSAGRCVLGILGSINSGKGQIDLVRACIKLAQEGMVVECRLYGNSTDVEYENQLRQEIAQAGRSDYIQLRAFVSDPHKIISELHAVISCARMEAMGRTLIEASLLGVPIIYADSGGSHEVFVNGEHGLAYPPGDIEALAQAIRELVRNPEQAAARAAHALVRCNELFSEETYAGRVFHQLQTPNNPGESTKKSPVWDLITKQFPPVTAQAFISNNQTYSEEFSERITYSIGHRVSLRFSRLAGFSQTGPLSIRLDPSDRPGCLYIHRMAVISTETTLPAPQIILDWTHPISSTGLTVLPNEDKISRLFATNNDPQIYLRPLPEVMPATWVLEMELTFIPGANIAGTIIENLQKNLNDNQASHASAEANLKEVIVDYSDMIEKRNVQIADQNAKILAQEADISAQNASIIAQQTSIKELNNELVAQKFDITEQRGIINRITQQLAETENACRSLELALDSHRNKINRMRKSMSWKVTAPFRALRRNLSPKRVKNYHFNIEIAPATLVINNPIVLGGWFLDISKRSARQIRINIGDRIIICDRTERLDLCPHFQIDTTSVSGAGFLCRFNTGFGPKLVIIEVETLSGNTIEIYRRFVWVKRHSLALKKPLLPTLQLKESQKAENRINSIENIVAPRQSGLPKVVFISHDCSRSGAPLLGLNICRQFQKLGVTVFNILLKDGPLRKEFEKTGNVFIQDNNDGATYVELLKKLHKEGFQDAFLNTTISGGHALTLKQLGYHTITLVHEMAFSIKKIGLHDSVKNILQGSEKVVVPSAVVSDSWKNDGYPIPGKLLHILPQANYTPIHIDEERKKYCRQKIRAEFNLPSTTLIVLAIANMEIRKGPDVFIEVARKVRAKNKDVLFVWIGYFDDKIVQELKLESAMRETEEYCKFIGFQDNINDYYAAADLFFLPSRSDAFPTVVLMALECALPVLLCHGCTGATDILHGVPGGMITEYSVDGFAQEAIRLLSDKGGYDETSSYLQRISKQRHSFRQYVIELLGLTSKPIRKVSCIVPNYNYSAFLPQRLDSIFQQTYPIFDIVFLDDHSQDDSINVAAGLLASQQIDYVVDINHSNSGSVFRQWGKGIARAKGDFAWIAEADDFCDNTLLASLMPFFDDPSVNLSYAQSCLVNQENKIFIENFKIHTDEISKTKWNTDYVYPFEQELNFGLAIKNTIPNASAVVMRRAKILNTSQVVTDYRVAGDWLFYIEAIAGGRIAHCAKVLNFYRRHDSSVFHRNREKTVQEIERIHKHLLGHYQLTNETIDKMQSAFLADYQYTKSQFTVTLDYDNYKAKYIEQPVLLIFIGELTYGGGEIFPIRLANEISRRGFKVYLLSFDYVPPHPDIIALISPSVLLVRMADVNQEGGLRQFVIRNKINYISTHNYHAEKAVLHSIADLPVFWTITMHGIHEHLLMNPSEDNAFSETFVRSFERADCIIYIAEKNLLSIKKLPFDIRHKLFKINNGFARQTFIPAKRMDYGIRETDIVLVFAARGIPEKGWIETLQAVEMLNAKLKEPQYHVFMIGDSAYVRTLRNKYPAPFIHFMGFQSNPFQFIQISDIGILPSYFISESQPLVIIEFLSLGKPCVASAIGEIPIMLERDGCKAGETVKCNSAPVDINELAIAVKKVADNCEYYAKGANELFKPYDMRLCADRYLGLWHSKHNQNAIQ